MADEQATNLRDWFAGQALQGLLAGPNAPKKSRAESPDQYAVRRGGSLSVRRGHDTPASHHG